MVWSTSALSGLSSDTQPCIVVTFENAKYIFNASENLNRSMVQYGRNWRNARALFLSQASVERTSGLPGLLMTFADSSIRKLDIVGPQGLTHLMASMRLYTYRNSIEITPTDIPILPLTTQEPPVPVYCDANVTVYGIPIVPTEESPESSKPLSKRKRDSSPDSPNKRLNLADPSSDTEAKSLERLIESADFRPEQLDGSLADEYRQLILKTMFPLVSKAEKGKKKGKKDGNAPAPPKPDVPPENEPSDAASNTSYRAKVAAGFNAQLPKYTPPLQLPSVPTMAYFVVGPQYRGTFDAAKAKALGIVGANRGLLTQGKSVTIQVKEGDMMVERIVHPEEVIAPSKKPDAVLVFDVPTTAHISSLVSSFRDSAFFNKVWGPSKTSEVMVRAIYHICGDGVLEDRTYKAFMSGFAEDVQHIIASKKHNPDPLTFTSAGIQQIRVNKIDDKLFPIPKFSVETPTPLSAVSNLPPNVHPMTAVTHVPIHPAKAPSDLPDANSDLFHSIISGQTPLELSTTMQERIEEGKAKVLSESNKEKEMRGSDVGIIPLGTGGSLPTRYRNVLSTLVKIPGYGNVLLDAGEGTWGQMARSFGTDPSVPGNVWEVLRDLKCIFVSHIHADHHLGLTSILAKRRQLDPPPQHPLYVVTIRGIHLYLREVSEVQDLALNDSSGNGVVPVISEALHRSSKDGYKTTGPWRIGGEEPWLDIQQSADNAQKMCQSLGLKSFQTVDVYHRCKCYGCILRHHDGWSIAFSGDTMPTDNLVFTGKGVTLLIHEATMGDDQAELAKKKAHSTISQAIDIGKRMFASSILLTHFSARYPKMPPPIPEQPSPPPSPSPGSESKALWNPHIAPAFDLAQYTIGDMWKLKHYMPALEANYEDTKGDDLDAEEELAAEERVNNVSLA